MSKIKHIYGLLFLLCFLACNTTPKEKTKKKNTTVNIEKEIPKTIINNRYCFLETIENEPIVIDEAKNIVQKMIDSTQLNFTIKEKNVEGVFNFIPAEQDVVKGKFNGSIDTNKQIKAIYVFDSEGETYKQGLIIQLKKDTAFYKLTELSFSSASKTLEIVDNNADFKQLPKIDCKN